MSMGIELLRRRHWQALIVRAGEFPLFLPRHMEVFDDDHHMCNVSYVEVSRITFSLHRVSTNFIVSCMYSIMEQFVDIGRGDHSCCQLQLVMGRAGWNVCERGSLAEFDVFIAPRHQGGRESRDFLHVRLKLDSEVTKSKSKRRRWNPNALMGDVN
ncbi:hypothetical protein LshimejAT787_0311710 [Lyophyllum shimeji]|uniref:Uncharacterized protein n=1 Tax=Lyophyllum shimeji TaxID=47721 RepID=A0A9P3PK15_LYOSH|nr:hypothetical protein LshimejAT787_0311710 [Lyophyllum shimeji]